MPDQLPPLPPDQAVKPPRFELRVALLFVCVFMPNGIHLPYFPLWLELKQFSPAEIAVSIMGEITAALRLKPAGASPAATS